MDRSTAELFIIMILSVLIVFSLWGLSWVFRLTERKPKVVYEKPAMVVVEQPAPEEFPRWIPWETEWVGGYKRTIDRPKPNFYPGRRAPTWREERGAPEPHEHHAK